MNELALTNERRDELATLLADEQRLRREYPKVADYLDMAPQLQGTGDERVDAAFDLRIIHYMTADLPIGSNPYWDIVAPFVFEHEGRRVVNGGQAAGSSRLSYAAMLLQAAYAYAIPSPETLEWVSTESAGRPLIELGSGRGYWAAQLAQRGLKIEAYDFEPPHATNNPSFPSAQGQRDEWHQVRTMEEFQQQHQDQENTILFLCWPPGWGNEMASDSLHAFEKAGGAEMIYVGEPKGGKTANDQFFDLLSKNWTLRSQDANFVSWWNLKDTAQFWTKS
ncbi:hypothetical protein [Amycolatopsis sp. CB00013]|uniref:hypothetical protein n=1 Tax=Amycolatopsis sp. CB00013 TaxID=1703945 RepID=UPI00093E018A|nr:hypothetical protein [Amycolatopsis sp. CB00013]